jgi:hypothetical protein
MGRRGEEGIVLAISKLKASYPLLEYKTTAVFGNK